MIVLNKKDIHAIADSRFFRKYWIWGLLSIIITLGFNYGIGYVKSQIIQSIMAWITLIVMVGTIFCFIYFQSKMRKKLDTAVKLDNNLTYQDK